jgi:hypothetical protein
MKDTDKKNCFIRLPADVHQSLRELSFFGGQKMADLVVQALLDWGIHEKAGQVRPHQEEQMEVGYE